MILKRKYDLDVVPGGVSRIIRVSRNDSSSQVTLALYAGTGRLEVPENTQAWLRGRALDEDVYCDFRILNNTPTVDITLSKDITGKAGKKPFELVLAAYDDSGKEHKLVTATFYLDIR